MKQDYHPPPSLKFYQNMGKMLFVGEISQVILQISFEGLPKAKHILFSDNES